MHTPHLVYAAGQPTKSELLAAAAQHLAIVPKRPMLAPVYYLEAILAKSQRFPIHRAMMVAQTAGRNCSRFVRFVLN